MKRITLNMDSETKIIIYSIVNDRFLKEILRVIKIEHLEVPYSKIVFSWLSEYYEKYQKAPKEDIQEIYKQKIKFTEENEEIETKDEIALFLSNLSKKYEQYAEIHNIDFLIEESIKYLKIRSGVVLKEKLEQAILENDSKKLEMVIANYKRVEKLTGQGIDLLNDVDKVKDAFIVENDVLITFPGDLGKIIQPINRGDFVSFFGPGKRGKSHVLFYTSLQALQHGNKVMHITLEMTENEMIRRAWPALTGNPRHTQTIKYAIFKENDEGKFDIIQNEKEKEGIDLESIEQFQKKLKRLYRKGNIKIIRPLESINVQWIESTLDNLYYYENYLPDVLVLDYADYMIPDKGFKNNENREKLNNIWVGLRQLAIRKNIAIVTASHTAKVTYDTDIKTSHASEDIRKINNVTMAIGLNQTKKEKEMNVMRLSLMEIREGRGMAEQVVVTQCLDIGRPCLDSKLRSLVNYENETKEENIKNYEKKRKIYD